MTCDQVIKDGLL